VSDWRKPVLPRFEPSGGLAFDTGDDKPHETYAMCFAKDDPAIELLYRGEVCPNCAYRMPATPNKQNLRLFQMRDYTLVYPEDVVRALIENEQCPVCRCLVRGGEVARSIMTEDRWSEEAVRREKARIAADREADERERAAFAKRQETR
jgi:Zn-finger nucleic acid-binding protein